MVEHGGDKMPDLSKQNRPTEKPLGSQGATGEQSKTLQSGDPAETAGKLTIEQAGNFYQNLKKRPDISQLLQRLADTAKDE